MYCSSIFVFSLVVLINLSSGAINGDSNNRYSDNSNYEMPQRKKRQEENLNIGNGVNRHNVVSISPNPGSQPDPLGNRFGGGTQNAQQPNPEQQRPVSNIGNGSQNRNTVSVNNGGRNPQTESGAPNARNNGRTSFVSPNEARLFNVGYGKDNQNNVIVNGQRIQPAAPVSNGGRTSQTQSSAPNARNNGGTSFVSPDGDLFNVGYGKNNQNKVIVNGQRIQPAAPVSNGGRTYRTQGNAGNARNNYGHEANINPVYLNGKVLQPAINDGQYSTYYTNGQTIKVLNSGSQQPTNRYTQLKTLYALSAQIQQITSQLNYEAARLNIKM